MSAPADPPKPAGGDPAMDDILASIRRILNEDEAPGTAAPPPSAGPAQAPPGPPPAGEPIELTEAMMVQPGPSTPPEPPEPEAPRSEAAPAPHATGSDPLMAPTVAAATTAAVGKLLRAVAQERSATVHRGGPTIEDVVREEIRPLLKEWLDQHLPPLVERLVRAEIERVVGRVL
jgi:cell pole-organizing protein PopZ